MTKQPIGILLTARHVKGLFDESHDRDLDGGMLEGLGKLLDPQTRVYVCPQLDGKNCLLGKQFPPAPPVKSAFDYFRSQNSLPK